MSLRSGAMKFDLIIANPPYGNGNSLVKQIIKKVVPLASTCVCLCPKNTYKDKTCWSFVKDINIVGNVFEDAKIESLSIATLVKDCNNTRPLVDVCLGKDERKLYDAVVKYNESHPLTYATVGLLGTFEKDLDKPIKLQQEITPQDGVHKTIRQARDEQQLFAYTKWTPQNGVHKDEAYDIQWNIHNEWPPYKKAGLPINAIYFQSKKARDNFSKWWYSCLKNQTGKKQRIGLTNKFLDLITKVEGGSSAGYDKYFPHLDWSHPWTDQEILKEVGLPEDFLPH